MTTVTPLSLEETQIILLRWEKDGLTDEEKDEFLTASLQLFTDKAAVQGFGDNIALVAQLAADIDKTFTDVETILWAVVYFVWPIGIPLMNQWLAFKERWRAFLRLSVGVAHTTSDILRRFDQVYLAQLVNIETDQDRIKAINALRPFISELQGDQQSATMSRQFLDLKRDIEAFVSKFNSSALETAVAPLLKDIETLDAQIKDIRTLLPIGGALFNILTSNTSSLPVVASLVAQRQKKAKAMGDLRLTMDKMNKLVAPIESVLGAQITPPNISLLLEQLVVFAEIWSSVQSQAVQFSEYLQGGLEAATNPRFKLEIELARESCVPLSDGLQDYKRQLESWI